MEISQKETKRILFDIVRAVGKWKAEKAVYPRSGRSQRKCSIERDKKPSVYKLCSSECVKSYSYFEKKRPVTHRRHQRSFTRYPAYNIAKSDLLCMSPPRGKGEITSRKL